MDLKSLLGQIVCIYNGKMIVFGPLQTNGEFWGFNNIGFKEENVVEIVEITVDRNINAARAAIKLL